MAADVWKQFERNPITHSVAHHLIAIAELHESVGYARVSDVARELNITRGSASLTLKTLKLRGLVLEDDNRFLLLSEEGAAVANSVRGKKHLFLSFFCDVLGVSADTSDEDTCKIEHLISNESADRLAHFLRFVLSGDERAKEFMAAWQRFKEPCGHDPADCPACNIGCVEELCEVGPPHGRAAHANDE